MQDLAIGLPGPAAYALVAEFHIFGYFAEWLEVSQTDYGYATVKGVFLAASRLDRTVAAALRAYGQTAR